jgi:hypothetical protein
MNLGFMIPSGLSGQLSKLLGYQNFFIWVLFASIPCFVVSWLVPIRPAAEVEAPPAARQRDGGLRNFLLYRAYLSILSIMGSLIFEQPKYQIINAVLSSLWLASTAGMFQWKRWAAFTYVAVTLTAIATALAFGYSDHASGALGDVGFGAVIVACGVLAGELVAFARVIRGSWSEFGLAVA